MPTRCTSLAAIILLAAAGSCAALDSSDLLFDLSFEDGVNAEFARGAAQPITLPTEQSRRLVDGLLGKGYVFGGKGSTIEYAVPANGTRISQEMYDPKANLFGDSGTLSLWLKPLPGVDGMVQAFFRCDGPVPIDFFYAPYTGWGFHYGGKLVLVYQSRVHLGEWMHFALTWRQNEACGYVDGQRVTTVADIGVSQSALPTFKVACEGQPYPGFPKPDLADHAVMDDVQVFRRPLTDEEIRALFERGHVTTRQDSGNIADGLVIKPERAYAGTVLVAPVVAAPIIVDGNLDDWQGVPAQTGFVERRLGVLDNDDTKVYAACDATNLYLAFSCQVAESLRQDPTHIWYPTGQFKAGMRERDSDVHSDDYLEFVITGKDGHEYRIALNAQGAMLDSRDGDKSWNTTGKFVSRANFEDWTAELAIPLAELGLAVGDTAGFNVIRSWKLFKSAQDTLCANEQSRPVMGKLVLGGEAAGIASLGKPWDGVLNIRGLITGVAGNYAVRVVGNGDNQHFAETQTVTLASAPATFEVKRRLAKPGDLGVVVRVTNPAGKEILVRSLPFVYVAASTVELENYPGWGRLKVNVVPVDTNGVTAVVSLEQAGKALLTGALPAFTNPAAQVMFDTASLPTGAYQVVTRLMKAGAKIDENIQPYVKKPLPEWYHGQAGVIDTPPVPWTPVKVRKRLRGSPFTVHGWNTVVECLRKEITFRGTLFPWQIRANGQDFLAGPIRIRVKRNGQEKILAAGDFRITRRVPRQAEWTATATDGALNVRVNGRVEFDGFTWMTMELSARSDSSTVNREPLTLNHLQVEIRLRREFVTLTTLGAPLLTNGVREAAGPGFWFGNERAGFAYWWEDTRGWEDSGEPVRIVAANGEVVIAMPFIQKPVALQTPRTISFGWVVTPTKPLRTDWRTISLYRGVGYTSGDYTFTTPNYPKPLSTPEWYQSEFERLKQPWHSIFTWYGFGPFMWVGAPEYAEWWREWRYTPSDLAKPDVNSTGWGPCCANSSGSDLHLWRLEQFVKHYPQRGIYIDCMASPLCNNEAHGCGYVDGNGVRQGTGTLLATRRHYERMYNIIKASDPVLGWVWYDGWAPLPTPWAAFADDNWIGECYVSPLGAAPHHNYHDIVDFPVARVNFLNRQWGHLNGWLTEMATSAGEDREKRAEWNGKLIRPPKDGQPGQWTLPRWQDYEHVAGLGILHDMWTLGGNDLPLPWWWLQEIKRMMHWDDHVRFIGYWELGEALQVAGAVPEKIACSVYYRPAGLKPFAAPVLPDTVRRSVYQGFLVAPAAKARLAKAGDNPAGWLILAPMNNTDADVTLTLTPNLPRLKLRNLSNGMATDIFRAGEFTWQGPPGWRANAGDPEPPNITVPGKRESFVMENGSVKVTVPKRSFRMLLVEPKLTRNNDE